MSLAEKVNKTVTGTC